MAPSGAIGSTDSKTCWIKLNDDTGASTIWIKNWPSLRFGLDYRKPPSPHWAFLLFVRVGASERQAELASSAGLRLVGQ